MWHDLCFNFEWRIKSIKEPAMEKPTSPKQNFVDPVCLMKVAPDKKDFTFTYKMRTYYFCAEFCRQAFEANPDKYLESKPAKRKGWWGRYLERLEKATGGRSLNCH